MGKTAVVRVLSLVAVALGFVRIHRTGKPDLVRELLIGTDVRNFKQVVGTDPT